MSTNKPPEAPKADDTPTTASKTVATDPKSNLIFTVFPRDATPKQIADTLNELRRQHANKH
jgi:hypothetical protein